MILNTILTNFCKMVYYRLDLTFPSDGQGEVLSRYLELLRKSEADFDQAVRLEYTKLAEESLTRKLSELERLQLLGNSYESALSDIFSISDKKILVYWNTFAGKTVTAGEMTKVITKMEELGADHLFHISLSDKYPTSMFGSKKIEYFNYQDFTFPFHDHPYCPKKTILYDHEEFIKENPLLEGYRKDKKLPRILLDDPQARYVGARPGQIIVSIKDTLMPGAIITQEMAIREVVPYVEQDRRVATGVWYTMY